jgi:hypothetical protein
MTFAAIGLAAQLVATLSPNVPVTQITEVSTGSAAPLRCLPPRPSPCPEWVPELGSPCWRSAAENEEGTHLWRKWPYPGLCLPAPRCVPNWPHR